MDDPPVGNFNLQRLSAGRGDGSKTKRKQNKKELLVETIAVGV